MTSPSAEAPVASGAAIGAAIGLAGTAARRAASAAGSALAVLVLATSGAARADGPDQPDQPLACGHAEDCDCPPPLDLAQLRALVARLYGSGSSDARAELLQCGKRVVERAHADFGKLTPPERACLLRHAVALKGIARPLAGVGFRDPDPSVRAAAIRLARSLRDAPVLSALVASEAVGERLVAAQALDAADGGLPALVQLTADVDPGVRSAAARGLGAARTPAAVAALVRCARDDREHAVRAHAAAALAVLAPIPIDDAVRAEVELLLTGTRPHAELEPLLPDLLRELRIEAYAILAAHPQPELRAAGHLALGASVPSGPFERARAIELLITGLSDPDLRVARAAVRALGHARLVDGAPALVERLRDRNDPLARDAATALARIAGERRAPTYVAWRTWLEREVAD